MNSGSGGKGAGRGQGEVGEKEACSKGGSRASKVELKKRR